MTLKVGDQIRLGPKEDCIIPPGDYVIAVVEDDGSFGVGGRTRAWPRRISRLNDNPVSFDRY